jgi:hypothetical protein
MIHRGAVSRFRCLKLLPRRSAFASLADGVKRLKLAKPVAANASINNQMNIMIFLANHNTDGGEGI